MRVDADTGNTVLNTFGLGANTGSTEESQNVYYSDSDESVFISYFASTNAYIAKVILATSTAVWAKKTDIGVDNTVYISTRFFFFDETASKIYVTSNYQTLYLFVCIF